MVPLINRYSKHKYLFINRIGIVDDPDDWTFDSWSSTVQLFLPIPVQNKCQVVVKEASGKWVCISIT